MGTSKLAVDGVVIIGEQGNYPNNEKGQKMYPRYEFFKQVVDTFHSTGRVVPVYSDKHLSVEWKKAKWMFDQSREMKFPFLAGSSLPVTWRRPPLELELGQPVEHAVGTYLGLKEVDGYHIVEAVQCMVERRHGGESGVAAVQCLEDEAVWKWTDDNPWAGALLERALQRDEGRKSGSPRENAKSPILFLQEYRSGLRTAIYLLTGHVRHPSFAASPGGGREPVSTEFWLDGGSRHNHFTPLTHYIEQMMVTGRPAYPVQRTLLVTGVMEALMDSSYQGHRRVETPYLTVSYRAPRQSLFYTGPAPSAQ